MPVSEFIALAGAVSGRVRRPIRLPSVTPRLMGLFDRRLRGYAELDHQRTKPWVVDHSALTSALGPFPVASHDEAIEHTIRWYRETRRQ